MILNFLEYTKKLFKKKFVSNRNKVKFSILSHRFIECTVQCKMIVYQNIEQSKKIM